MHYRARGRFSPECPPSAMSNFLHVTLTPNPKISDFGGLDGAASLDVRCLYSGFGLFHDSIERFCSFGSSRRRNFASAREIPCGHSVKCHFGENPDSGWKSDPETDISSGRHSHVFRMVPARVVAVPTHGRPVVMNFSVGFMQNSMKFRQNTAETAQKYSKWLNEHLGRS